MKKIFYTFLFFAFLAGFPHAARADFEDGDRVPDSVVAPLMAWVEAQTGVKVPVLPRVVASRSQLTQIVSRMNGVAGRARALYVGGVVLLDHRMFDAEDSTQLSLLVHELVHYAQSFKRGPWACAQAKEVEAYTLQNKWLEERGHSPFVTASWINRMAACPAPPTSVALVRPIKLQRAILIFLHLSLLREVFFCLISGTNRLFPVKKAGMECNSLSKKGLTPFSPLGGQHEKTNPQNIFLSVIPPQPFS